MPRINLKLTSGATILQGVVIKGGGKALPIYTKNAGLIFLDPADMEKIGIMDRQPVLVKSAQCEEGVIVYGRLSPDAPHPGVAFMPRGPWTNLLIDPNTYSSGCPMYKCTDITVEPAPPGEKPLNMPELMKKYYIEKFA